MFSALPPNNGHHQTGPVGPVRARNGHWMASLHQVMASASTVDGIVRPSAFAAFSKISIRRMSARGTGAVEPPKHLGVANLIRLTNIQDIRLTPTGTRAGGYDAAQHCRFFDDTRPHS